jgi:hypothetical protein
MTEGEKLRKMEQRPGRREGGVCSVCGGGGKRERKREGSLKYQDRE